MAEFRIVVTVDPTRARRGAQQVRQSLDRTGRSADRLRGILAAALGGAAVVAGVSRTVRTLATFEQSMSTVRGITQATRMEFRDLREEAAQLGATTRFSATQAAEGMIFLSRAGFDTAEVLESVDDTLRLAQAGALDLGRAADIASNVLQGFRLETSEAGRVVDILALTANSANTNVEQLGDALKFVAPVAAGLGVSIEETSSAIAVLSNNGLQATLAGTGLRRVLSELESPSKMTESILRSLGVTANEVTVSQVGLTNAVQRLAEASITTGQALEIFGDRGGPAFEVLVSSIPDLIRFDELLNMAGGTAERVSVIMDDNLNGSLLRVSSAWEAVTLSFGNAGATDALEGSLDGLAFTLRSVAGNIELVIAVTGSLSGILLGRFAAAQVRTIQLSRARSAETIRSLQLEETSAFLRIRLARQEVAEIARNNALRRATGLARLSQAEALIAAENRVTAAVGIHTAAEAALARQATITGRALSASRVALAALGGPIGLITTALTIGASAWYLYGTAAQEGSSDAVRNIERIVESLRQRTSGLSPEEFDIEQTQERLNELLQQRADLEEQIGSRSRRQVARSGLGGVQAELDRVNREIGELEPLLSEATQLIDQLGVQGAEGVNKIAESARNLPPALDQILNPLSEIRGEVSALVEEAAFLSESGLFFTPSAGPVEQLRRMAEEAGRAGDEIVAQEERIAAAAQSTVNAFTEQERVFQAGRAIIAETISESVRQQEEQDELFRRVVGAIDEVVAAQEEGVIQIATVTELATSGLRALEDSFISLLTTGQTSFSQLVTSVISDVARLVFRLRVVQPLLNLLAGALGATVPIGTTGGGNTALGRPFASGGIVRGPGGPRADRVLARLSAGEFIVNARSTSDYRPLLEAINRSPRFQDGGFVGSNVFSAPQIPQRTRGPQIVEININVEGGGGDDRVDVQRRRRPDGDDAIDIYVREVVDQYAQTGGLDRPLDSRYGIRPTTFGR